MCKRSITVLFFLSWPPLTHRNCTHAPTTVTWFASLRSDVRLQRAFHTDEFFYTQLYRARRNPNDPHDYMLRSSFGSGGEHPDQSLYTREVLQGEQGSPSPRTCRTCPVTCPCSPAGHTDTDTTRAALQRSSMSHSQTTFR